jgi:peptidoglycan/LPS O-acetylase OafA/YrhL
MTMNDRYDARHESANLDLLRSIAVLCVFMGHFPEMNHRLSLTSWHLGQLGVLIFFVHTSLVLMQSMERLGLQGRALFTTFYVRRWFRIYPLSMFCVVMAYACQVAPDVDHASRHWNLKELLSNLSLTQNLFFQPSMVGALWSLPLEVQMYVTLPFLYLFFRHRPLWWIIALYIVSVPVALIQQRLISRLDVLAYAPCFLGGMIAWRMAHINRPKLPGWLWPVAIAAVCPIWFSASREHNLYYRWAFCLMLGLVTPWFKDIQWYWVKSPAKLIARYSYGIYLSHITLMMVFFLYLADYSAIVRWLVFVTLCVTVPVTLYHLLEAPLIEVGRNLTRRNVRPRAHDQNLEPATPLAVTSLST